jgi:hypothetical protein
LLPFVKRRPLSPWNDLQRPCRALSDPRGRSPLCGSWFGFVRTVWTMRGLPLEAVSGPPLDRQPAKGHQGHRQVRSDCFSASSLVFSRGSLGCRPPAHHWALQGHADRSGSGCKAHFSTDLPLRNSRAHGESDLTAFWNVLLFFFDCVTQLPVVGPPLWSSKDMQIAPDQAEKPLNPQICSPADWE